MHCAIIEYAVRVFESHTDISGTDRTSGLQKTENKIAQIPQGTVYSGMKSSGLLRNEAVRFTPDLSFEPNRTKIECLCDKSVPIRAVRFTRGKSIF